MKPFKKLAVTALATLMIVTVVPMIDDSMVITAQAHGHGGGHHGGAVSYSGYNSYNNYNNYQYYCGGSPAHGHTNGACPYYYCGGNAAHLHTNGICPYVNAAPLLPQSSVAPAPRAAAGTALKTVTISDDSYDNAAFNASYYATNNPDVYKVCGNDAKALYTHFVQYGMAEGRQSSEQFSITAYEANNQDLAKAFGQNHMKYYSHYNEHGAAEGRVSK